MRTEKCQNLSATKGFFILATQHSRGYGASLTLEHLMWLQPSFFWMGDLQEGHGLELATIQRQLAASSTCEQALCTETTGNLV